MKGISHYKSDAGLHVIRVHYTADPDKDPATIKGAAWFKKALEGYTGGVKSASWRQEMEIDWDSTGGELVFPQLSEFEERIVVRPFAIPESWDLYGSFDYGFRNPSSFHVYAIDHDSNIYSVWEYYRAGQGYRQIARELRACPYFDRLKYKPIADPSIWAKNQQATGGDDNPIKSIAQLFYELVPEEQIIFVPGKKGGDITMAEKINGDLWNEKALVAGDKPKFFIFQTCPMQIWEFKKIRFKDYSAVMQEHRNLQEELVDRDNHAIDDCAMFMMMFFSSPQALESPKYQHLKETDRASYDEWKSVAKMHGAGQSKQGMGDFE
jgi:hypothetical protein